MKQKNLTDQTNIKRILKKTKLKIKEGKKYLGMLFNKGISFEDKILNHLKSSYPNDFKQVAFTYEDSKSDEKISETISHVLSGTSIIVQAVLKNDSNKTYGVVDLLVRSDWFSSTSAYMESTSIHIFSIHLPLFLIHFCMR